MVVEPNYHRELADLGILKVKTWPRRSFTESLLHLCEKLQEQSLVVIVLVPGKRLLSKGAAKPGIVVFYGVFQLGSQGLALALIQCVNNLLGL